MRSALAVISGVLAFGACIPYINDIIAGRVVPARSTRIMFLVLLSLALFQQHDLGSRWGLLFIVGEFAVSIAVFIASIKYGIGGVSRTDIICYSLLFFDVIFWTITRNSLLGIHITILADLIAVFPTILKTIRFPKSETPLFFWLGGFCALLAMFAEPEFTYSHIAFPLYLALVNVFIAALTYRTSHQSIQTLRKEPHVKTYGSVTPPLGG